MLRNNALRMRKRCFLIYWKRLWDPNHSKIKVFLPVLGMIQSYLSCCIFKHVLPGFGQCPEFKESALSWKKENPKLELPLKQKNIELVFCPSPSLIILMLKKNRALKAKELPLNKWWQTKTILWFLWCGEGHHHPHLFPTEVLAGLLSLIFSEAPGENIVLFEQTVDRLYIQKFS